MNPSDESRKLARQMVKDTPGVRVKFGQTNGRECLHVYTPGVSGGRTYYTQGEWENSPMNARYNRSKNESKE